MDRHRHVSLISRRELLRAAGLLATSAVAGASAPLRAFFQQAAAPLDPVDATRAQMAMAPIETMKLADNLTLLSGPGGNIVVLHGADGKVVVDTFVLPVWPKLKQTIDGIGNAPIKLLINSHWHFDHTDNNASFRQAGAMILAHENTRKRLMESHDLLGMHFTPVAASALPTETFKTNYKMQANGENLELAYIPPAHTDTDISIQYTKANVLHVADTFFNGMYPFIDAGTGGSINGMIAAAGRALKTADTKTRIVPGHGPLGDKAALTKYRDMLVTVRDRVRKLRTGGKKLDEVVAAKPTADLDSAWGKGIMSPDAFVGIVYNTL